MSFNSKALSPDWGRAHVRQRGERRASSSSPWTLEELSSDVRRRIAQERVPTVGRAYGSRDCQNSSFARRFGFYGRVEPRGTGRSSSRACPHHFSDTQRSALTTAAKSDASGRVDLPAWRLDTSAPGQPSPQPNGQHSAFETDAPLVPTAVAAQSSPPPEA